MTIYFTIGYIILYLVIGFFLNQALEDEGKYSICAMLFYPAMIVFALLLALLAIICDIAERE